MAGCTVTSQPPCISIVRHRKTLDTEPLFQYPVIKVTSFLWAQQSRIPISPPTWRRGQIHFSKMLSFIKPRWWTVSKPSVRFIMMHPHQTSVCCISVWTRISHLSNWLPLVLPGFNSQQGLRIFHHHIQTKFVSPCRFLVSPRPHSLEIKEP
jgi:hypothetical protein